MEEPMEKPTVMPVPFTMPPLIQQLTAQDFINDRDAFARLITKMRKRGLDKSGPRSPVWDQGQFAEAV